MTTIVPGLRLSADIQQLNRLPEVTPVPEGTALGPGQGRSTCWDTYHSTCCCSRVTDL